MASSQSSFNRAVDLVCEFGLTAGDSRFDDAIEVAEEVFERGGTEDEAASLLSSELELRDPREGSRTSSKPVEPAALPMDQRQFAITACPLCGGRAEIPVFHKGWADYDGVRLYLATCEHCGKIEIERRPAYLTDVVCKDCVGRLTWASDCDTPISLDQWPLVCGHCLAVATGGLHFVSKKQSQLVNEIHRVDATYDSLWLRSRKVSSTNHGYHNAATDRADYLERKRRRLVGRLQRLSQREPTAHRVLASELQEPE
jgi:hypothetical protein